MRHGQHTQDRLDCESSYGALLEWDRVRHSSRPSQAGVEDRRGQHHLQQRHCPFIQHYRTKKRLPVHGFKCTLGENIPISLESGEIPLNKTRGSFSPPCLLSQRTYIALVQCDFVDDTGLCMVCSHREDRWMKDGDEIGIRILDRVLCREFPAKVIFNVVEFGKLKRHRLSGSCRRQSRKKLFGRGRQRPFRHRHNTSVTIV